MEDVVGYGAIRRLGVDLANLTSQLALLQSSVEFVQQVARGVMPDTWDKIMSEDDAGHPEMHVTLRGEQVDSVTRLLAALTTLG